MKLRICRFFAVGIKTKVFYLHPLSSDGVTVIDKSGKIIYHGGIVDLNAGITKGLAGTGETAARILSDNGIAIKISQDGNIKIFYSIQEKPFIF